ncbi:MAG: leucine-rich repeat protein [Clostridia bacterium]|nr:leucine-rich repeat protein [Clostridia bacterium]
MKKITALLLAFIICLCAVSFNAFAAESGNFGNLSWRIDGGVLTVSGNGAMEDFNVFELGQWHAYSDSVTSVVVEEGVTSIGGFAFLGFDNLQSVSLPEGITSIGDFAFQSCGALEQIDLPQSLVTVMSGAFSMCGALKSIELPAGVTQLEEAIFEECIALESVRFNCTLTSIPPFTFDRCNALAQVYYSGSAEEWESLTANLAYGNSALENAELSFGTDEDNSSESSEDQTAYLKGDVNDDGVTDNLDAAFILRHDAMLAVLTGEALAAGDVNGDDRVDSLDASMVLKYDAGIVEKL